MCTHEYIQQKAWSRMFTSTGFVIVPSKKQSQCPSTVEWIHNSNSHNKLLHNNDKARTTETCSNINETEHDTERKMPDTEVYISIL